MFTVAFAASILESAARNEYNSLVEASTTWLTNIRLFAPQSRTRLKRLSSRSSSSSSSSIGENILTLTWYISLNITYIYHYIVLNAMYFYLFNVRELGQTLGDDEGQGSLACGTPWGHKEWDTTQWLNNNNNLLYMYIIKCILHIISICCIYMYCIIYILCIHNYICACVIYVI